MSFSIETEKEKKRSFPKRGRFTTIVCRKPTFSGAYSDFESFLPRFFCNCSNWTQFHTKLIFLKETFCMNGYSENFIDK